MNNRLIDFYVNEDAPQGDITTQAVFLKSRKIVEAHFLAKEDLVVSGFWVVRQILKRKFKSLRLKVIYDDGRKVKKGTVLATLKGSVTELLVAERLILNFLQRLSGVATTTAQYVCIAKPYGVQILDTRKTVPGLRVLEKRAVSDGGGVNHRMGLSDQYLIKDNHIEAAGSLSAAIYRVRSHQKRSKKKKLIQVEVRTLAEFKEALVLKPDIILLDNMTPAMIRRLVGIRNKDSGGRRFPALEISGGVNLKNLKSYARLGVERISVGALTHSVKASDISLKIIKSIQKG